MDKLPGQCMRMTAPLARRQSSRGEGGAGSGSSQPLSWQADGTRSEPLNLVSRVDVLYISQESSLFDKRVWNYSEKTMYLKEQSLL